MSEPGHLVELVVGGVAAGGGCVARLEDGRVAFVRHCLPGERVRARITDRSRAFVRADAVEIVEASPRRVSPPCRYAGPGRCGGCDWQHVSLAAQRELKQDLIGEQLSRVAGVEVRAVVEAVAGDDDGLGWRSRVRYSVSPGGHLGLRKHRSHAVQRIDRCAIAGQGVQEFAAEHLRWPGAASVEVLAAIGSSPPVVSITSRRRQQASEPMFEGGLTVDGELVRGPAALEVEVLGHRFRVGAGVFWQVHVGAPPTLGRAVLDLVAPCDGMRVADLYAGAGLFSILLAGALGPTGEVLAVERHPRACADFVANSAGLGNVRLAQRAVSAELLEGGLNDPLVVVLDPPREGAGLQVMNGLLGLASLRRIVYVSCDPATFARDLRAALDARWSLTSIRAYDLFPMTEHVELVAAIDAPPAEDEPGEDEPAGYGRASAP